jgi:hypothetical protein
MSYATAIQVRGVRKCYGETLAVDGIDLDINRGVLALVARGRTNAEIGRALYISEATAKTHLLRAFGKRFG